MGYANFSSLQPVVVVDVNIRKNSMHHVVLRYANPSGVSQEIVFTMIPGGEDGVSKKFKAKLPPTTEPSFIRLTPFEEFEDNLTPGPWVIEMQSMNVSIDYLVTVPNEYLSATALRENINRPCRIGETKTCKQYAYPPYGRFSEVSHALREIKRFDLDSVMTESLALSTHFPFWRNRQENFLQIKKNFFQTLVGIRVSNTRNLPKEIQGVNGAAAVLNPKSPTTFTLTGGTLCDTRDIFSV